MIYYIIQTTFKLCINSIKSIIAFEEKLVKLKAITNNSTILDWFNENYTESHKECEEILIQAERTTPSTIKQYYEACVEIKKFSIKKVSLKKHIKLLRDLSIVGLNASDAGEKIKEVIINYK